jgi:hypothetical protein
MAEAAIELHGSGGLTGSEAAALAECEEAIEAGLRSFVVVGDRLYRIREERLYRATHGTFEAYCRDRWTLSVRQAEPPRRIGWTCGAKCSRSPPTDG